MDVQGVLAAVDGAVRGAGRDEHDVAFTDLARLPVDGVGADAAQDDNDLVDVVAVQRDAVAGRAPRGAGETVAGLPASGKTFTGIGIDIFTVRDGRITDSWHAAYHYDMAVQLGGRLAPAG